MAQTLSEPRPNRRADRHHRLRLDRPGHAAADRAPLHLRPAPGLRHRPAPTSTGPSSSSAACTSSTARSRRDNYRELLTAALPRRTRLLRQPLGRHQLARPDAPLPRARRPLHRHRRRAVGGALLRPLARRRPTAPTTRCARPCGPRSAPTPAGPPPSAAAAPTPAWCRGCSRRRCSGSPPTLGAAGRGAARPRRLGAADAVARASRACTSPSATPRPGATPSRWHASSTPGRSRASSPRASSRPSSAGARHETLVPAERPPARAAAARRRSTSTRRAC